MPLAERRQVHQRLGAAAEDIEDRAWHLALGADRPSEEIAGMLDAAAGHAASRGAPEEGATLEEQAARLTPAGQPELARDRTVHAADHHFRAGNMARSRELIQSARPAARPARCARRCSSGWPRSTTTSAAGRSPSRRSARRRRKRRTIPALRAHAEQELAFARVVAGDLPAALHWANASLRSAEQAADPRLMAHSLARIAVFEFLQGHGVRLDLLDRAETLDASAARADRAPAAVRPIPQQEDSCSSGATS